MPDVGARIRELRAMEGLSSGATAVHRMHPLAKLLSTLTYIAIVVSFGRFELTRLAPYLFYPFIMMALAELPYRLLLSRVLIALPFSLFAGVTNVIFFRETAFEIRGVVVSYGVLSLVTILLKTYLCVMAALLLVASTPFTEITAQLRRLRIPVVFILVFEMTYRYIGVLAEEALSMTIAYRLRSGVKKSLDIRHMGAFAGQLLLRGFDRAERVHVAMRCRGYSLRRALPARRKFRASDALWIAAVCVPAVLFRFIRLPGL